MDCSILLSANNSLTQQLPLESRSINPIISQTSTSLTTTSPALITPRKPIKVSAWRSSLNNLLLMTIDSVSISTIRELDCPSTPMLRVSQTRLKLSGSHRSPLLTFYHIRGISTTASRSSRTYLPTRSSSIRRMMSTPSSLSCSSLCRQRRAWTICSGTPSASCCPYSCSWRTSLQCIT